MKDFMSNEGMQLECENSVNCLRVMDGRRMEKSVNKSIKIAPAPMVPGSVNEAPHDLAMNPKQSCLSASIYFPNDEICGGHNQHSNCKTYQTSLLTRSSCNLLKCSGNFLESNTQILGWLGNTPAFQNPSENTWLMGSG